MKGEFNKYDENTGKGTITPILELESKVGKRRPEWDERLDYNFTIAPELAKRQSFKKDWPVEFDVVPPVGPDDHTREAINLRY
ncbi:hypothetical protein [Pseudomonas fluorescens]|uniref:hypothetical protein n=1 Tax=Pseudomonas fluorescens TaxID=294 RepID=UPI000AD0E323|nr:hypothetical protein [Pseudomonas fluorescens]